MVLEQGFLSVKQVRQQVMQLWYRRLAARAEVAVVVGGVEDGDFVTIVRGSSDDTYSDSAI